MTRRVRLWITAVVIMASAALAAGLTITAVHASKERSWGTGHSGQSTVNQTYTYVYLADFNKVSGGPVFSRLAG